MPDIRLPDASVRHFDHPVTPAQVAADIGPGLAKAAIGAKIDGVLSDLSAPIDRDVELALITAKNRDGESDDDALYLIRHSAAHVMAEAIQRLWPDVQLVYGPPVENGFYYDLYVPEHVSISSDDFPRIEAEMAKVADADDPFEREVVDRERARELFADDPLKLERLEELADDEVISPRGATITSWQQAERVLAGDHQIDHHARHCHIEPNGEGEPRNLAMLLHLIAQTKIEGG